jgi:hypothetical protein
VLDVLAPAGDQQVTASYVDRRGGSLLAADTAAHGQLVGHGGDATARRTARRTRWQAERTNDRRLADTCLPGGQHHLPRPLPRTSVTRASSIARCSSRSNSSTAQRYDTGRMHINRRFTSHRRYRRASRHRAMPAWHSHAPANGLTRPLRGEKRERGLRCLWLSQWTNCERAVRACADDATPDEFDRRPRGSRLPSRCRRGRGSVPLAGRIIDGAACSSGQHLVARSDLAAIQARCAVARCSTRRPID